MLLLQEIKKIVKSIPYLIFVAAVVVGLFSQGYSAFKTISLRNHSRAAATDLNTRKSPKSSCQLHSKLCWRSLEAMTIPPIPLDSLSM